MDDALTRAGTSAGSVAVAVLCASGADWDEDYAYLVGQVDQILPDARVVVQNDALGGLWAGSPDGTGVALVVGTGLALGARGPDDRQWHGAFWARRVGPDELVDAAVDAVVWSDLGVGPSTVLTDRILRATGARTVSGLLEMTTRRERPVPLPVGRMATLVLDAAAEGDAVAGAIVSADAGYAARMVVAAAGKTGLRGDIRLVGAGGMFRHPRMAEWLAEVAVHAAGALPGLQPVVAARQPVVGAVRLANWSMGTLDAETDRALDTSHPADEIFSTLSADDADGQGVPRP